MRTWQTLSIKKPSLNSVAVLLPLSILFLAVWLRILTISSNIVRLATLITKMFRKLWNIIWVKFQRLQAALTTSSITMVLKMQNVLSLLWAPLPRLFAKQLITLWLMAKR